MPLQVYSTLTRKKEPFHKQPGESVTMYVCGPTVYKPSHIGHMVGPVIFDTIKRYLTYLGYKVTWVVNITDVDDKLIVRAKELNTTVPELAAKMTADYRACLDALNVKGIDHFPKATEHIGGMIAMMQRLIEKGYAYAAGGDVYFDVSKDADYGKLCNRDPEQLEAGSRIEVSDRKRNPGDFAMWKGAKPGEPKEVTWDSPWGPGRPGWHIECSVMSQALLGETLDIHGGGLDLKFPHHENELAQSESDTDKPFAHAWMHNGLLKLRDKDGKEAKMAGSIGNVLNVSDALKHMGGDALRFFVLSTHYRSPIDLGEWDWKNPATPIPDGMVNVRRAYETFVRFAEQVERDTGKPFAAIEPLVAGSDPNFKSSELRGLYHRFREYMDDDFNTGGVVGVLFELVRLLNSSYAMLEGGDPATRRPSPAMQAASDEVYRVMFGEAPKPPSEIQQGVTPLQAFEEEMRRHQVVARDLLREGLPLLKQIADVMGLTFAVPEQSLGDDMTAGLMQLLIDLRNNLRTEARGAAKDNPLKKPLFDQTDLIRARLGELGVILEDRPAGTTWRVG